MTICVLSREVYHNGIVIPENKFYEVSGLCDCPQCRMKPLALPQKWRNLVYAYVENEDDIEKAYKFVKKWECDKRTDGKSSFYYIDGNGEFKKKV